MDTQSNSEVQGMHCQLKGSGTIKCTVSLHHVCLTQYSTVNLLVFGPDSIEKAFIRISRYFSKPTGHTEYSQDFTDLCAVLSKVQKTEMSLISGDKIITYAVGEPVFDEKDGYLYLTPSQKEWWSHPRLEPIVTAIQQYLPDFEPWLLQSDKYLGILSAKSSLL